MADTVYCFPEVEGEHIDPNYKRYVKGLGLTDINIIPHFHHFEKLVFSDGTRMLEDILLPDSKKSSMIAFLDGSYIVQSKNGKELFGEVYLLYDGTLKKINENDEIIKI